MGCSRLQYVAVFSYKYVFFLQLIWLVGGAISSMIRSIPVRQSIYTMCIGTLVLESHSVTEFGELRAFLGQNLTLLSHFLCILDQSSKIDDTQDVKPNQDSPCYTNKYIKDETHTHPFQSEYHTCHNFLVSVSMLEL